MNDSQRKEKIISEFKKIFPDEIEILQIVEDKTESKSNSIIISQPSLDDMSENIVVENSNNLSSPKEIKEVTENLDEVISTYEASTQN